MGACYIVVGMTMGRRRRGSIEQSRGHQRCKFTALVESVLLPVELVLIDDTSHDRHGLEPFVNGSKHAYL